MPVNLSDFSNEELLALLGIESGMEDVFRNYNMTDEQKREFLLEKAKEKNQKYYWQGFIHSLKGKYRRKKIMTLEQQNELKLYTMTIKNRLECIGKSIMENHSTTKSAVEDLQSIRAKTDYMINNLMGVKHDWRED